MPAKDTKKVSPREKAKIIAEKRVNLDTPQEIANKHGVSISTVYQAELTASPEVLALASTFEERMREKAMKGAERGVEIISKRIENPDEPLSAVNQSVKTLHEIYRLESGQSTSNVAVQHDYTARCLAYLEAISKHDPGASVERKREYLLNSSALADVPVEVREKIVIE